MQRNFPRMRNLVCVISVVTLIGLASPAALAQKKKTTTPAAEKPAATLPANLNAIAQAAAKGGVYKCLNKMNQITNFVGANAHLDAALFLAPKDPDKKISSVSLGVLHPQSLSFVDAQFSPGAGNTCSGAYEAVTYWNNSCQEVADKLFSGLKPMAPLGKAIAALDGGPNMRVFLMPAGNGCVAIKKELLY